MSTFITRPSISAHVRAGFTVARGHRPHRLNVMCAVCGPVATISAFEDLEAASTGPMAEHVSLVTGLLDLPDTPTTCLACAPHADARGWTHCRRHTRMTLLDAIRTHWRSGDVRRLVRAWMDLEDEYTADAEEIAAEHFSVDWPDVNAAVQTAYRRLPGLEAAAEAAWRQQAERRASERGRWPFSVDYGDADDDPAYYPESQSTMCQTGT